MNNFVFKLPTGTVVDRRQLSTVPAVDMAAVMADIYSTPGARVIFVDDPKRFFSMSSLMTEIESNGSNLDLMLAYNNVTLTGQDFDVIKRVNEIKESIRSAVESRIAANIPPYPFETLPNDWNIDEQLFIGKVVIRRNRDINTGGEFSSDYSIGLKAAESLWNYVSPYWAGIATQDSYKNNPHHVRVSGEDRIAGLSSNFVKVGCQKIRRYELEQVALKLNWKFPVEQLS